jgi:uncharacterized protein YegJ (DUF2314 family)
MSDSEPSKVFLFDNSDPEMQAAYQNARATFRYFWREVAWERRRIVPGLDLACVKAPFADGAGAAAAQNKPEVEHMWLSEVDFDGQVVSGVLLNAPNWLKTVKQGDAARIPLAQISDWMYAGSMFVPGQRCARSEVYGAHTVNLMRARMGRRERQEHDDAWGLDFGDPKTIRLIPYGKKKSGGLLHSLFGKHAVETPDDEHPMSEAMAPSLKGRLAEDPSLLHGKDDNGWTLLHQQSLAGSTATVKVLLEAGADVNAVTAHGRTPLQLAKALGWDKVVALLVGRGGNRLTRLDRTAKKGRSSSCVPFFAPHLTALEAKLQPKVDALSPEVRLGELHLRNRQAK